jgi:hypothetical protein
MIVSQNVNPVIKKAESLIHQNLGHRPKPQAPNENTQTERLTYQSLEHCPRSWCPATTNRLKA